MAPAQRPSLWACVLFAMKRALSEIPLFKEIEQQPSRMDGIWMYTSTQMTHNVTRSGCFDEFYSIAIRFVRIFFAIASCPA